MTPQQALEIIAQIISRAPVSLAERYALDAAFAKLAETVTPKKQAD